MLSAQGKGRVLEDEERTADWTECARDGEDDCLESDAARVVAAAWTDGCSCSSSVASRARHKPQGLRNHQPYVSFQGAGHHRQLE